MGLSAVGAWASDWTQDYLNLRDQYQTYYAPLELKQNTWGFDYSAQAKSIEDRIAGAKSLSEARSAVVDFFNGFHDYHVFFVFDDARKVSLPFEVRKIGGRFWIVWVDPEAFKGGDALYVGDELLEMDGKTPAELESAFAATLGKETPSTDQSLQDVVLSLRLGMANLDIPNSREVSLRVTGASGERKLRLKWVREGFAPDQNFKLRAPVAVQHDLAVRWKYLVHPGSPFAIGGRASFFPAPAKLLWQTDSSSRFQAYTFQMASGKVRGVLRIPTFNPATDAANDLDHAILELEAIVKKMQETADDLLIDVSNNPGGATSYVYGVISLLIEQPVLTPRHVMSFNAQEAADYQAFLEQTKNVTTNDQAIAALGVTYQGYEVSLRFVTEFRILAQTFVDAWSKGQKRSEPLPLLGVSRIAPHSRVHFTKSLFVLVNELSFSGAEFFSAILQDAGRAKILGARTAGAGGYVVSSSGANHFGLSLWTWTASVATRPNGLVLEGLGVKPDREVTLLPEDVSKGFAGYSQRLFDAMN